ncbi:MAG: HEAT repeat domain-containing protein [Armatimonadota bacterium]
MRWLLVGSVLIVLVVGVLVYLRWGRRVAQPPSSPIASEAAYLEKRDQVRSLQLVKGSRPFTPQEMQILREASRDMTDFRLRCRALTALSYVKDPQQRKEAIELAVERLKDDERVVRHYALWALGNLGAKEAIPQILPLLNDPDPTVREQAKKTLKKLGYQVSE